MDRVFLTEQVGVLISLVGAFVVSPAGTAKAMRAVRAGLERLTPPLLRPWPQSSPTQYVSASTRASSLVIAQAEVVPSVESLEEKVERLHRRLERLGTRLGEVEQGLRGEVQRVEEELARVAADLRRQLHGVRELVRRVELDAAAVDARALPVLGIGVLVAGEADYVEDWPLWAWAGGMFVAVAVAAVLTARAVQAHRAARRPAA